MEQWRQAWLAIASEPLNSHLVILHDVDMPPCEDIRHLYTSKPEESQTVRVLEASWQRYASASCFGGVTIYTYPDYLLVNGFPNGFW